MCTSLQHWKSGQASGVKKENDVCRDGFLSEPSSSSCLQTSPAVNRHQISSLKKIGTMVINHFYSPIENTKAPGETKGCAKATVFHKHFQTCSPPLENVDRFISMAHGYYHSAFPCLAFSNISHHATSAAPWSMH